MFNSRHGLEAEDVLMQNRYYSKYNASAVLYTHQVRNQMLESPTLFLLTWIIVGKDPVCFSHYQKLVSVLS